VGSLKMIIREKLIFWILLPVLAAIIAIGINVQGKKKQSSDEFLKDIESVTEKAKAKKKDSHE
jgi:phosphate/sulfate permease